MDLDFFLKWVTGRNLAVFFGLAALVWLADVFQEYPRRAYEQWRYPAGSTSRTKMGEDIAKELDFKESLRLRMLHKEVSDEIAAAERRGRQVGGLQRLADAALSLDMPGYRKEALEKLNEVRLKIPRGEQPRAVSPNDDEKTDIPPDVQGRARPARRRR